MAMDVWFRATRDEATGYHKLERCHLDGGRLHTYVVRWYDKCDYPKAAKAAFNRNSHARYARSLTAQPGG